MRNAGLRLCWVAVAVHALCVAASPAYAQPKIPALPTNVPGLPALDPQALKALAPPAKPELDKGPGLPASAKPAPAAPSPTTSVASRPSTRGVVRSCKVEVSPKGPELKAEAGSTELRLTLKGDRGCLKAASSEELWVEANLRSAKQEVLLQVEENLSYEPRRARVFLVAGEDQLEFIVSQAGTAPPPRPAPHAPPPTEPLPLAEPLEAPTPSTEPDTPADVPAPALVQAVSESLPKEVYAKPAVPEVETAKEHEQPSKAMTLTKELAAVPRAKPEGSAVMGEEAQPVGTASPATPKDEKAVSKMAPNVGAEVDRKPEPAPLESTPDISKEQPAQAAKEPAATALKEAENALATSEGQKPSSADGPAVPVTSEDGVSAEAEKPLAHAPVSEKETPLEPKPSMEWAKPAEEKPASEKAEQPVKAEVPQNTSAAKKPASEKVEPLSKKTPPEDVPAGYEEFDLEAVD